MIMFAGKTLMWVEAVLILADAASGGGVWNECDNLLTERPNSSTCGLTAEEQQNRDFFTMILGNWAGETAAGFENRLNNPRYLFLVSDKGREEDGLVPVVVQICQNMIQGESNTFLIRVDLYKVYGLYEQSGQEKAAVIDILGNNTNDYQMETQMSGTYRVEPGQYMVIPSTFEVGQEKAFLIRIYTPCLVQATREIDMNYTVMQPQPFAPPENAHLDSTIRYCSCEFGRWVANYNAGGQFGRPRFYSNPFVMFVVPKSGKTEWVNLTLMRKAGRLDWAIGVIVFPLDETKELRDQDPSLQGYLNQQFAACPETIGGNKGVFYYGSEASATYELLDGSYLAVLHLKEENQETNFALLLRSSSQIITEKFNWA